MSDPHENDLAVLKDAVVTALGEYTKAGGFAVDVVDAISDLIREHLRIAKKDWLRMAGVVESTDP